ncbi:hypothetical protein CKA32_000246 [Geitlerinema sp. FC II]|nr:hypothetical protein CKA32_000246 [Geitlerinema sp. FC II]
MSQFCYTTDLGLLYFYKSEMNSFNVRRSHQFYCCRSISNRFR